jgi:hypothetical protein
MTRATRGTEQASFLRAVNERLLLEHPHANNSKGQGDWRFFCECGSRRCRARLAIETGEFERLLWISGGRVVARSHWRRGERVLVATSRYLVVRSPD